MANLCPDLEVTNELYRQKVVKLRGITVQRANEKQASSIQGARSPRRIYLTWV